MTLHHDADCTIWGSLNKKYQLTCWAEYGIRHRLWPACGLVPKSLHLSDNPGRIFSRNASSGACCVRRVSVLNRKRSGSGCTGLCLRRIATGPEIWNDTKFHIRFIQIRKPHVPPGEFSRAESANVAKAPQSPFELEWWCPVPSAAWHIFLDIRRLLVWANLSQIDLFEWLQFGPQAPRLFDGTAGFRDLCLRHSFAESLESAKRKIFSIPKFIVKYALQYFVKIFRNL